MPCEHHAQPWPSCAAVQLCAWVRSSTAHSRAAFKAVHVGAVVDRPLTRGGVLFFIQRHRDAEL